MDPRFPIPEEIRDAICRAYPKYCNAKLSIDPTLFPLDPVDRQFPKQCEKLKGRSCGAPLWPSGGEIKSCWNFDPTADPSDPNAGYHLSSLTCVCDQDWFSPFWAFSTCTWQ
jgi:hypothetical protein